MAWYNAGTVAVTNNATAVTGTGTAFTDYVDAGQGFRGPDGLIYEIASVVSATALTLATPYKGATASGQAYSINPAQGYLRDLATQAASLVLSFAAVRDGIGQGKFPDGTVGVPGIRFASDEDTGFYRGGTNLLDIATNGTKRARFEASAALRLIGPASGEFVLSFDAGDVGYNSRDSQIRGGNNGSNQTYLDFYTSNAAAPARAARITETGAVGIGTTSPAGKLHVAGSIWNDSQIVSQTAGTATITYSFGGQTSKTGIGCPSDGTLSLYAGSSTERARIDSSGNFGIGVTSVGDKFHVLGNILQQGDNGNIRILTTSNRGFRIGHTSTGTTLGRLYFQGTTDNFATSFVNGITLDSSSFRSENDNLCTLGTSGNRWSVVYAATGTINTSDRETKQDIGAIPDEWLDAWGDLDWQRYKFIDAVAAKGDDARWHIGLIAQDVRDVFASRNLDALTIGLLCFDQWEDQHEPIFATVTKTRIVEQEEQRKRMVPGEVAKTCVVEQERINYRPINPDDPDSLFEAFTETIEVPTTYYEMGEIEETYFETVQVEEKYEEKEDTGETRVTLEAGQRWGLRYDECQAMEAAYQRREIERLRATIAALQAPNP